MALHTSETGLGTAGRSRVVMTIPHSHARSTRQHHPSRIYRLGLHYPQKSSCPPESLSNPPSSTPFSFAATYFHTSPLPPCLTPSSHQTPLSPVPYLLHTPSCRVWESWHELPSAEQEQTPQAAALPQTKLPPLSSSAEFIPRGTCRGIRGPQPHTEGETSHVTAK